MDIKSVFPSKWLSADDLGGREHLVTITHVAMEDVESGKASMPTVYFQGGTKGLVLNKTNANNISDIYGAETNNWTGQSVILFPTTTDFQGRTVPCIRVKNPAYASPPANGGLPAAAPVTAPVATAPAPAFSEANPPPVGLPVAPLAGAAVASGFPDLDDEVPF